MITLCHKCHLGLPHLKEKARKNTTNYMKKFPNRYQIPNTKRNNEVAQLREEGFSLREIGEKFKISGERVRQILLKVKVVEPAISGKIKVRVKK